MLSFGALNALSTAEDSSVGIFYEVKQEEQEAEALEMYNEALRLYCNDEFSPAEKLFSNVLQTDLIIQAPESIADGENLVNSPALFLKYNVLKNLARIYEKLQDNEKALDFYLNASVVDETDVNLWLTIASIAKKVLNIRLERFAYEKGLICSPNNWPCLDNLISTLYILGDYAACLDLINRAFQRNDSYVKGHAFRDQIFKEEPHFKNDCLELEYLFAEDQFNNSDKYQDFIEEALVIRGKRTLSAKRDEIQEEKFTKPFIYYTWVNFGECLLCLYNDLVTRTECKSLAARVDLMKYYKTKEQQNGLLIPSAEMFIKKGYKTGTKELESKKRRKLSGQQEATEPQPKRRSARVKISKRKEIDVNWSDLISSFLPSSLKSDTSTDTDCSQDSLTDSFPGKLISQASNIESFKKELVAVSDFVNSKVSNNGCIDLFGAYLLAIVKFYEQQQQWQQELSSIFVNIYKKYRKHASWPNLFSLPSFNETEKADLGKMILFALELELEQLIMMMETEKRESPASSPLKSLNSRKLIATDFLIDFHYLSFLGAHNSIIAEQDFKFRTRFYWLHANYCIMQNEIVQAVNALNNCAYTLSIASLEEISISNCCKDNIINQRTIMKKLEFVQQSQTLDEIQVTFNAGKYEEVIDLLKLALNEKIGKTGLTTERPLQLVLLLESYLKTGQIRNCIECCLIALNEAVASGISDLWRVHLNHLLVLVFDCFSDVLFHYDYLLLKDKQVFADSFIKIIEISMTIEQIENHCVSTLPWILLHKLLKFDLCLNKENTGHSLIEFLRTAHDYLGRKHWCCHDKGMFLQYFIKELQEMNTYDLKLHEKEVFLKDMEQCLYCLYGDPCRKSKSKVLVDHNDAPITLNWSNAKVLYDFYKPNELPQFDLRANTITPEVQNVFRKIVAIVPKKDIEAIPFEELVLYIEGGRDFPEIVEKQNETPDLFYYLGDFYFKNKEFSKALKFYMHDVSINPNRFQSWAAMALARGSRLEEKINQCDLKSDSVMRKHITTTLRCFEKAVSINNEKCVILEEYGQTAYMLNSYASKRLKEGTQEGKHDLPTNEYYLKMKNDMLNLSFKCFNEALQKASGCENEQWLHYYMLGKASEKLKLSPDQYLEFYQKSLRELYKNGGQFQKKISYHGAPQYSIEVVELFFRIHASILKVLMYMVNIEYDILEKHLNLACCQAVYREINDDIHKYNVFTPDAPTPDADSNKYFIKTQSILQLSGNNYLQNSLSKTCFFIKPDKTLLNDVDFEVSLLIQDILLKIESNLISESNKLLLKSKDSSTCTEKFDLTVSKNHSLNLSINNQIDNSSQNDLSIVKLLLSDLVEQVSSDSNQKSHPPISLVAPSINLDSLSSSVGSNEIKYLTNTNLTNFGSAEEKGFTTNGSTEKEKSFLTIEKERYSEEGKCFGNLLSTFKKNLVQRNFKNKEERYQYISIAQKCLDALAFCLQRFPEHYKSRYMMSYFFMVDNEFKNLKISRSLLLGDCIESNLHFNLSSNGIISSKKKTNLFQYLWRIPVNEIDRPGSFLSHVYCIVKLLLDILYQLDDTYLLLHVAAFLHKTPEKDRKYLHDNDRAYLAIKAFDFLLDVLKKKLNNVTSDNNEKQKLFSETFAAFKHSQKLQVSMKTAEYLLIESYLKMHPDKANVELKLVLEEAMKICYQF
ncbi:calcineurin-binding protein cabin-1 isoform X1 [Hydra vulgaris]|uniref:calcineurin-binding protein cabin-1 isoform X1 n=1 Tax=Hydra vulgaris TaxID=6087 RepID=UPI001F5F2F23|nr:calcineurin-binding protein cabin-1 [Hydra vulgaris]